MGLEGLDSALGGIAAMDVGSNELVLHFPRVFNGGLEFGADFVVEDLEINVVATVGKAGMMDLWAASQCLLVLLA